MKLNKKTAMLFAGMGLLLGSVGAVGLQVHAQQTPNTADVIKTAAAQTVISPVATPAEVVSPVDTGNVQNEVKDANEVNGVETNDENEVNDVANIKDADNVQSEIKDVNEVEDANSAKDINELNGAGTNDGVSAINQQ